MGNVYVLSDVHGNWRRYNSAMNVIKEDDHVYLLGDAIDRGPDGIKILFDFFSRRNTTFIMGNHELFLYRYLKDVYDVSNVNIWTDIRNGGLVTKNAVDELSIEERVALLHDLKESVLCMTVIVNGKKYRLGHGAPTQSDETILVKDAFDDTLHAVTWNTPLKYNDVSYEIKNSYWRDKERNYVVGHVPVQRINDVRQNSPIALNNIFAIDGGMCFKDDRSKLFLMCLNDLGVYIF